MNKYVITGGPGIGKTTVIELLASKGFKIVPEMARIITEEEELRGSDVLPWKDLVKYQTRVAEQQLEAENSLRDDVVFLDRGLVDGHAYCRLNGTESPRAVMENGRGRYKKVFLLERLPTYQKDQIRLEDEEEAIKIHQAIKSAYKEFGYEPVAVPVLPPEERVKFILERLESGR